MGDGLPQCAVPWHATFRACDRRPPTPPSMSPHRHGRPRERGMLAGRWRREDDPRVASGGVGCLARRTSDRDPWSHALPPTFQGRWSQPHRLQTRTRRSTLTRPSSSTRSQLSCLLVWQLPKSSSRRSPGWREAFHRPEAMPSERGASYLIQTHTLIVSVIPAAYSTHPCPLLSFNHAPRRSPSRTYAFLYSIIVAIIIE